MIKKSLGAAVLAASLIGCAGIDPAQSIAAQPAAATPSPTLTAVLNDDGSGVTLSKIGGQSTFDHALNGPGLEGICTGVVNGENYLFAFDDNGFLGQWWVSSDARRIDFVRQLPGTIELDDCHVHSDGHQLYALEEGMGLWAYPADPEAEVKRTLVERYQPWGKIDADVEAIEVVGKTLRLGTLSVALDTTSPSSLKHVSATIETDSVAHSGDAADDPAIWLNTARPEQSLILAADKRFGLRVYGLNGKETQAIPAGRINNIDLRNVTGRSDVAALAAGSNRTSQSVSFFTVAPNGKVRWLRDSELSLNLDDPYGLCMQKHDGQMSVFVNDKDGRYQQFHVTLAGDRVQTNLVREFNAKEQPEGCAGDDDNGRLFFGVEEVGLMEIPGSQTQITRFEEIAKADNTALHADVEGMDIYHCDEGGYLVVSSQGNDSYAVFDRLPPFNYRGSFRIVANYAQGIDGASETDGLAVHSGDFGSLFPHGILVVQDGRNVSPSENQNFKIVDWRVIENALGLSCPGSS